MSYAQRLEQQVKERIATDLAEHQITTLRADGLYRHYRCRKPGTGIMGFDIVTWPGSLCYTGDMGDYLFQRASDMISFMSTAVRDYRYAAEKCVAHDGRLKEFSEEAFEEILREELARQLENVDSLEEETEPVREDFESDEDFQEDHASWKEETDYLKAAHEKRLAECKKEVSDELDEIRRAYANYTNPADAITAMYESGLWDGGDLPDCKEWTFHFLWALHAIKWFCDRVPESTNEPVDDSR